MREIKSMVLLSNHIRKLAMYDICKVNLHSIYLLFLKPLYSINFFNFHPIYQVQQNPICPIN